MKTTILLLAIFLVVPTFSFNVFAETVNEANNGLPLRTKFDFDGDGKADVSVIRPSVADWYCLNSSNNSFYGAHWGLSTDDFVPADYDGDGKTDLAVRRNSDWYIFRSSDNTFWAISRIVLPGSVPVPADYDGDGKADTAVFLNTTWQYAPSSNPNGAVVQINFDATGRPVPADYDGDGKADPTVFRTNAFWDIHYANGTVNSSIAFLNGTPVPADYDGDGKTDLAVYQASVGRWTRRVWQSGALERFNFGTSGDVPAPADYDGDGKADLAVYRYGEGYWYIQQSTAGFKAVNWGI